MRSLGLILLIAACRQSAHERPPIDATRPPIDATRPPIDAAARGAALDAPPLRVDVPDEPWTYADVRRKRAAPPAALSAPMKVPLRAQDLEALCALDVRALVEFDHLPARDRDTAREYLDNCGEYHRTRRFCGDARAIVEDAAHAAPAFVRAAFEMSCREDSIRPRPVDSALATRLRSLGLLSDRPLPLAEDRNPSAAELMELDGRVIGFDTEMPYDHAHVARQLARLCPLDAVFDQPGEHELDAWVAGEHLRVRLRDLDDWYDVGAVVGLVNEAARTAGSDCRVIVLPNDGQEAFVAGGPGAGLVEALRAGLLTTADPDAARRAGIAVE